MELSSDLLKLILPEFLIEHFDLVKHHKKEETLHVYFEEKNNIPCQENSKILIAHGFHKQVTIQDFPLPGNTVYLHVKCRRWLIFPQNMGSYLSIDETALSKGKPYTITTNKKAKSKKGAIVAILSGTKVEPIIEQLLKIPKSKRNKVKEITLDMANSMKFIAKKCFPKAMQVTDRFHVQKLAYDAVQQLRVKHRWEAIEEENNGITVNYSNGDSKKQLLARGRYALYKSRSNWTANQEIRAGIIFQEYPDLKQAYELAQKLGYIYENTNDKLIGLTRMARWFNEIEQSGFKVFKTVKGTFERHYDNIINYFERRSTNASAESFNAKIKNFRRQLRGVKDTKLDQAQKLCVN